MIDNTDAEEFRNRFDNVTLELYQALQILRDDNWEYYLKEGNTRKQILEILDYVDNGTDFLSFLSRNTYRQRAIAGHLSEVLGQICKLYNREMQPAREYTKRSFSDTLHLMENLVIYAEGLLARINEEEEKHDNGTHSVNDRDV